MIAHHQLDRWWSSFSVSRDAVSDEVYAVSEQRNFEKIILASALKNIASVAVALLCTFARETRFLDRAMAHTGTGRLSQLHEHWCSK